MQSSRRKFPNKQDRFGLENMQRLGHSMSQLDISSHSTMSREQLSQKRKHRQFKIYDDPKVVRGYESVPLLELDHLPRGGISLETKAVGRIQVSGERMISRYYSLYAYYTSHIHIFFLASFSLEFLQKLLKTVCY